MNPQKPAIAWIIPGGLGTGANNAGVPVMEGIVRLLARDFDVTVFQLFPVNKDFRVDGFTIVPIESANSLIRLIKLARSFARVHRDKKFVAVHGFWALPSGLMTVILGKIHGVKSIVSVLGGDGVGLKSINYGRLNSTWSRSLIFFALRRADVSTVLTKFLADKLQAAGLKGNVLTVVPWGVDQQTFRYEPRRINPPYHFLHVANLHPVKNQEMLLRTFDVIRKKVDARLRIIGEGVDQQKVIALIHTLQLQEHVEMLSPVAYQELPRYYHEAHVLLHTSLSEGQSEVVTEAMSCGVLVCGTSVGLMYDQPDCCFAVAPGDVAGLAEGILQLLTDQAGIERIQLNATLWTTKFDLAWTAQQYSQFYLTPMM